MYLLCASVHVLASCHVMRTIHCSPRYHLLGMHQVEVIGVLVVLHTEAPLPACYCSTRARLCVKANTRAGCSLLIQQPHAHLPSAHTVMATQMQGSALAAYKIDMRASPEAVLLEVLGYYGGLDIATLRAAIVVPEAIGKILKAPHDVLNNP